MDCSAGFWISSNAASAHLRSKRPKSPQLDSVTTSQSRNDFIQDGVNHLLHIALKQVRVLTRNTKHQLRFDHDGAPNAN
jgi:hypothetical protein